jgi:hypothetical protein
MKPAASDSTLKAIQFHRETPASHPAQYDDGAVGSAVRGDGGALGQGPFRHRPDHVDVVRRTRTCRSTGMVCRLRRRGDLRRAIATHDLDARRRPERRLGRTAGEISDRRSMDALAIPHGCSCVLRVRFRTRPKRHADRVVIKYNSETRPMSNRVAQLAHRRCHRHSPRARSNPACP